MRRHFVRWSGLLIALALLASACGDDDSASAPEPSGDDGVSAPEPSDDDSVSASEPSDDDSVSAPEPSDDDGVSAPEPSDDDGVSAPEPSGDGDADARLRCGLGTGQAATGEPIVVGGIVGETGPDDFSSAGDAAAAYFDCVNANGGINGRPVEYILEDDQWNPEVAGQVAARLVHDENVVALVGGASFVECGVNAELYAAEGVVSVPGVGVSRQCFESANIAAVNQGPRLSTLQIAQYAASDLGATSFVCMAPGIPGIGDWVCDGVAAWAESQGYTAVSQLIDPALPDATAVALDALSADADAVLVAVPAGAGVPILAAVEQQDAGDDVIWAGPTSLYDLDFPDAIGPYWSDRLWVQAELNVLDSSGADNQQWLAVLDAYGSPDDPRDTFSQAGFLSAKFFTDAMLAIDDPSTIDRAVASEAIRNIRADSDLLCGTWYFGPGDRHNANHAGRVVVVTGGGYSPLVDCNEIDDPDLVEILELEAELGITG